MKKDPKPIAFADAITPKTDDPCRYQFNQIEFLNTTPIETKLEAVSVLESAFVN
jgi:hypothetical protein